MALQIRYGTDTEFELGKSNIVSGEMGVTTDTERMVVGTDSGTFMELPNIESLAPAYDSSETYTTGDVVSYGGKFYVLMGGSATGAWDSTLWEETTLGEVMEKLKLGKNTTTESGDIVSFTNPYNRELPFLSVKADITAVQSGSGDPSPTNVRPITGFTGANVYDDGKYDKTIYWNQKVSDPKFTDISASTGWRVQGGTVNGASNDELSVSFDGSGFGSNQVIFPISLVNGHTFYSSVEVYAPDTTHTYWLVGGSSGALVDRRQLTTVGWHKMEGIWTYATYSYWMFRNYEGGAVSNVKLKNPMVYDLTAMFGAGNEPTTIDEFKALFPKDYYAYNAGETSLVSKVNGEPYREVTISFGSTVYGGVLNVTTGVLTVTHGIVDMDSLNWTYNTSYSYPYFTAQLPSDAVGGGSIISGRKTLLCSEYLSIDNIKASVFRSNNYNLKICQNPDTTTRRILVQDSNFTDATTFKQNLTNDSAKLVYELATPTEVQLTPTEVKTLLGQNNIWADTGEVEVTYYTRG